MTAPPVVDRSFYPLTIADVFRETADTKSFILDVPSGLKESFAYQAGQFCTFRATIHGHPVARSYSMSSAPETGERLTTTVKRVPNGAMSNWMNDVLSPGDTIEAMRPSGLFVLQESEAPLIAFAAGSGITPVISVLKAALITTNRDIFLVYANRDAESVIFVSELEKLGASWPSRLTIHHHLDTDSGYLDADTCVGLIDGRSSADFYVCGPVAYMDIVEASLSRLAVPAQQLFIERFLVPADEAPPIEPSPTERLIVRIQRRRRTIPYQPGDTILEAARRGGLEPPFSCEGGSCATCMAHIDSGEARMRVNNALTPEEVDAGWVLTCQALPISTEVTVTYD